MSDKEPDANHWRSSKRAALAGTQGPDGATDGGASQRIAFQHPAARLFRNDSARLFAGTGNLSIEALSRGAEHAVLVDSSARSAAAIKANLRRLGLAAQTEVWVAPVARSLRSLVRRRESFDFIFLDPPYEQGWAGRSLESIAQCNLLRDSGTVVVEHSMRETVKPRYGRLQLHDQRRYGDTRLSFYKNPASIDSAP